MTRCLTEPQQRLQHVQTCLVPAFLGDPLCQRLTVVVAQFVVALALGAAQAADDCVFDALWQVAGDVAFRAAKDEWSEYAREGIAWSSGNSGSGGGAASASTGARAAASAIHRAREGSRASEHAGIEEFEQ